MLHHNHSCPVPSISAASTPGIQRRFLPKVVSSSSQIPAAAAAAAATLILCRAQLAVGDVVAAGSSTTAEEQETETEEVHLALKGGTVSLTAPAQWNSVMHKAEEAGVEAKLAGGEEGMPGRPCSRSNSLLS